MSLSPTVQDKADRLGPLACEAEASSVSSRSQFRVDLITIGVNFQIMWLKNALVRSIGRLAVIDIRLAYLFGDRREQEPREIPNPRTGLVRQTNALEDG